MKYYLIISFFLIFQCSFGQNQGTILVVSDVTSKIILDGETVGTANANTPFKILVAEGEHYIELKGITDLDFQKSEIISIEGNKQKVFKATATPKPRETLSTISLGQIDYSENPIEKREVNKPSNPTIKQASVQIKKLNVITRSINIPGQMSTGTVNGQTFVYPEYVYAFDTGDEVFVNLRMTNKNGTNGLTIYSVPENTVIHSINGFQELYDSKFTIPKKGMYKFIFKTMHSFDRVCDLRIDRISTNPSFNTLVEKKRVFEAIPILNSQNFTVNSTYNLTAKNSRIILPINIPEGAVECHYSFTSYRNKEDVEKVRANIKLLGKAASQLLTLSGAGAGFGVATIVLTEILAAPPGTAYCNVYLLDESNKNSFISYSNFIHISDYSRLNFSYGNVRIPFKQGTFYLGFENKDPMDAINVEVEAIAIIEKYVYSNQ